MALEHALLHMFHPRKHLDPVLDAAFSMTHKVLLYGKALGQPWSVSSCDRLKRTWSCDCASSLCHLEIYPISIEVSWV